MPNTTRPARSWRPLLGTIVIVLLAGASVTAAQSGATTPLYKNASASPESRAADLVNQLSLAEQIGQMVQIQVGHLYGDCSGYNAGPLNAGCAHQVLSTDLVGSILSGGGDVPGEGYYPNTPQTWADQINAMEKYAIDNSPHHIPIVYGADVVHGHNDIVNTTLFPQQIGLGASFDRNLVTSVQKPRATPRRRRTCAGPSHRSPTWTRTRGGVATTSPSVRIPCSTARWPPQRWTVCRAQEPWLQR